MKKYFRFIFVLLLVSVLLGGCILESANDGNPSGNENTTGNNTEGGDAPTLEPTQTEPVTVDDGGDESDSPVDIPVTSAKCPATTGTQVSFIHPGHGYCMLVPSGYSSSVGSEFVAFYGKSYGDMEPLTPFFQVLVEPAAGRTALEMATTLSESVGLGETPKDIVIGGQTGYLLNQIPGRSPAVSLFIVHNDLAYSINSEPLDIIAISESEPYQDAAEFWELFKKSFTFFDPEPAATPQANLENCTLDSEFVADITIPDGTLVAPGQTVVKRWLLRNNGTCDWSVGFELFQSNHASTRFQANQVTINLPMAAPGAEVEVSVIITMLDPADNGEHLAQFQMRTGDGETFGGTPFALVESVSLATAGCFAPPVGMYWYVDENVGVCFIYPDGDYVVDSPDVSLVTVTIPAPVDCGCDAIATTLTITKIGEAGDMSLQDFANSQLAKWGTPEIAPTISDITIGGYSAVLAEGLGLPGVHGTTEAYLIADGVTYSIRLFADGTPDSDSLWNIILGAINFFN